MAGAAQPAARLLAWPVPQTGAPTLRAAAAPLLRAASALLFLQAGVAPLLPVLLLLPLPMAP